MSLDPWRDAALLAQRLRDPATQLILVLVAEAWCGKCRALRPRLDALAAMTGPEQILLVLDLDEHGVFLGDYLPQDLPELLVYDAGTFTGRAILQSAESLDALLAQAQPSTEDPGLWAALVQEDWAG